jgi:cytoskeletal protein CcmA (bactofilin family)
MSVFKRYIGQDTPDPANHRAPLPETRSPESTPAPAAPTTSQAPAQPRPSAGARNILSSDVEIKGTVKFSNDLVIDGKIEGEIHSNGNLTVGENARIKAEIKTATVVVYGKVHGNIIATERVDLKSTAEVVGDIKAKTLSVEPGAIFLGKSTVGSPESLAPSTSPAPAAKAVASSTSAAKTSSAEVKQATLPGTQL